jgi:hypothetical protein
LEFNRVSTKKGCLDQPEGIAQPACASYGGNPQCSGRGTGLAAPDRITGEVLRVVESLADEGMTLLMVTHEMSFARKVSDRLVFMHAGRIHEMGPPEVIFGAPQTPELKQFLSSIDA